MWKPLVQGLRHYLFCQFKVLDFARIIYAHNSYGIAFKQLTGIAEVSNVGIHERVCSKNAPTCQVAIVREQILRVVEWFTELRADALNLLAGFLMDFIAYALQHRVHGVLDVEVFQSLYWMMCKFCCKPVGILALHSEYVA